MPTHVLPTITNTPVGIFTATLYTSLTVTPPTFNTILEIGELEEKSDDSPSMQALGELELIMKEDYTNHPEGFWYKVLGAGDAKLYIVLDDGNGDKYFFTGFADNQTVEWSELYVSGSSHVRTAKVTMVSTMSRLLDGLVVDWKTEVLLHKQQTPIGVPIAGDPDYVVTVLDLFASMLKSSGLNTSFNSSDATYICDSSNPDIKYNTLYNLSKVWIITDVWYNAPPITSVPTSYWYSSESQYLPTNYITLRDLISVLLKNFGLVMRIRYDSTAPAGREHKIDLFQRGRAYNNSANLTFGVLIKSDVTFASDLFIDAVKSSRHPTWNNFNAVWMSTKFSGFVLQTSTAPNYVKFDIDLIILFGGRTTGGIFNAAETLIAADNLAAITGQSVFVSVLHYYDYTAGSYVLVDASTTGQTQMLQATCGYYFRRFGTRYKKIISHYSTMKGNDGSTNGQDNVFPLRRQSYDDGTGSTQYFSNRVRKISMQNELEVEWIKETV